MERKNILQIENITIRFGGLTAVNRVSLCHREGEILSIIGPNGAGKTTLFNLLTGIYQPDEGKILFCGKDITHSKPHERVRAGIARTFQNIRLFSDMTVLENLLAAHPDCQGESVWQSLVQTKSLRARRERAVRECEHILDEVGLIHWEDKLATSLPYGKQRLLEIARAMATNPRLILLDEPGAGMNAAEKQELSDLIQYITEQRQTNILLIEHDMKFVMKISERIIVLDHGEKIAQGIAEQIQNDQAVIEAYIGKGSLDEEGPEDACS